VKFEKAKRRVNIVPPAPVTPAVAAAN